MAHLFQFKGIVVGVYEPREKDGDFVLTKAASELNSSSAGKLTETLKMYGTLGLKCLCFINTCVDRSMVWAENILNCLLI